MKIIKKYFFNKHNPSFVIWSLLIFFSISFGASRTIAKEISGYIKTSSGSGIQDVIITFEDIGSTTTRADGYYSKGIPNGWNGTATPTKSNYTFEPPSQTYSNVTSNLSNQNYTGSVTVQPKVTISGYVRTSSGSGIEDVVLTFSNVGGTAETNSSGYYSRDLDSGWSGTVTPAKGGYTFIPVVRNYSNLTADQKNQDYTESVEDERYGITIDISGAGTIQLNPEQDSYTHGSLISVTAIAGMIGPIRTMMMVMQVRRRWVLTRMEPAPTTYMIWPATCGSGFSPSIETILTGPMMGGRV